MFFGDHPTPHVHVEYSGFSDKLEFDADALRWDGELARRGLTRADVEGAAE